MNATLTCFPPDCDHTGSVSLANVDAFVVGATSVCRCHKDAAKLSEALGVRAFDCGVSA